MKTIIIRCVKPIFNLLRAPVFERQNVAYDSKLNLGIGTYWRPDDLHHCGSKSHYNQGSHKSRYSNPFIILT